MSDPYCYWKDLINYFYLFFFLFKILYFKMLIISGFWAYKNNQILNFITTLQLTSTNLPSTMSIFYFLKNMQFFFFSKFTILHTWFCKLSKKIGMTKIVFFEVHWVDRKALDKTTIRYVFIENFIVNNILNSRISNRNNISFCIFLPWFPFFSQRKIIYETPSIQKSILHFFLF